MTSVGNRWEAKVHLKVDIISLFSINIENKFDHTYLYIANWHNMTIYFPNLLPGHISSRSPYTSSSPPHWGNDHRAGESDLNLIIAYINTTRFPGRVCSVSRRYATIDKVIHRTINRSPLPSSLFLLSQIQVELSAFSSVVVQLP